MPASSSRFVSVSVVVPYPGTPLREKMLAAGLIEPGGAWEDYVIFGKKPRWRTANFSADELLQYQRSFTRSFYLHPRYVLGQLASIRSREELGYWTRAGLSYMKWYATGVCSRGACHPSPYGRGDGRTIS